jgi:transcriptional regulator PpsR
MSDVADPAEARRPFRDAEPWLASFDNSLLGLLLTSVGEIVLLIDRDGRLKDVAGQPGSVAGLEALIGRPWAETVTVESRAKIQEMLSQEAPARWRQVNQLIGGAEVPVRYLTFPLNGTGRWVAIGRDERANATMQQRLLQVQQSLERDYLSLRQAESRYRLLFDMTAEPMVIVEAASRRIREINPAASALFASGAAPGQPLTGLVPEAERERLIAFLGAAALGGDVQPLSVPTRDGAPITISARAFRQSGANYLLLRLAGAEAGERGGPGLVDIIDRMPDAFVLTDADLKIISANTAFVDAVHAVSLERLRGRALDEFLGRPGIDLDLILGQLAENEVARNVATILRGLDGGREEVEVSAVRATGGETHYGFSLRVVARRLRDLPPIGGDLPRSVEQLTELVGRMPLKDIVRESTDLIERQCIEAALAFTSNNRASAAEILGLSRQSLYSKLHRHGLVSPDTRDED